MSQLASSLLQAADQNKELLTILAATDYAPSSLTQNGSYISDLKSQIASTDKQLARLHLTTEDERKVCCVQIEMSTLLLNQSTGSYQIS